MSVAVLFDFVPRTATEIMARVARGDAYHVAEPYDPRFLGRKTSIAINTEPFKDTKRYKIVHHEHFSSVYDTKLLAPTISYANVDYSNSVADKAAGRRNFSFDPQIPESQQTGSQFYERDEFDRGHLTQRYAVSWGDEAYEARLQSDYYTNIVPQYKDFNRILWSRVEDECRQIALERSETGRSIEITGVWYSKDAKIYDTDAVKVRRRIVPNAYWKIVVFPHDTKLLTQCFFVPHAENFDRTSSANDFSVSLQTVSDKIGYTIDKPWDLSA